MLPPASSAPRRKPNIRLWRVNNSNNMSFLYAPREVNILTRLPTCFT
jgi:hypothetical protein